MRVVVAEDAMITRHGLVHLLRDAGIEVVGETEVADAVLRKIDATRPDAAIVDIRMPPTHTDEGLHAAKTTRAQQPDVAVLILSRYIEPRYAMELPTSTPSASVACSRTASSTSPSSSTRYAASTTASPSSTTIVSRLLGRRRHANLLDQLTAREREVLELLAEGLSNSAIAQRLVITERTVEAHVKQIFAKLDITASPDSHRRVLAVLAYLRG